MDVRILPGASASGIYVNGQTEGVAFGNGGGSLTSTASLFVGNCLLNSTKNFSGSIYTSKLYSTDATTLTYPNYNNTRTRFGLPNLPLQPVFLLDVSFGAIGAYSTRKLSSAYQGPCLDVVRSSDSVSSSIGFTLNGDLDTETLLSFIGPNTGYVKTWYDQSGYNAHATQSVTTYQPIIVSSGTLVTLNNKPSISFSNRNLLLTSPAPVISFFTTFRPNTDYGVFLGGQVDWGFFARGGINLEGFRYTAGNTYVNGGSTLVTKTYAGTLAAFPLNTVALATILNVGGVSSRMGIATLPAYGQTYNANLTISEILTYKDDQTENRTSIESSINTYYTIF